MSPDMDDLRQDAYHDALDEKYPPKERTYEVCITTSYVVTVTAKNKKEAEEKALEHHEEYGPDKSELEWEVCDVEEL
jgi:hypothetical protein